MNSETIRPIQMILILMTVIGLKNHVTIIPPLLHHVGRNGWASVLLSSIIHIPWVLLLVYIHKKTNNQDLSKWLRNKFGNILSTMFNYTLATVLILLAAFTMIATLHWVNSTFLPETPVYPLLVIYTALCVSLASTNLKTIAIANAVLLFGVVVFGFFVAFVNMQIKDYMLLRPFFEGGLPPVLKGIVYPASGMVELVLLLFIQHQIKGRMRFVHYIVIIAILTILTLGPLVGAITEFGPVEATKQRYPAYEEWGLVTVGQFIEHVDFLSIYQWLTGAFIRVGLLLYITVNLLNLNGKKRKVWTFLAPTFIIFCLALLMIKDYHFIDIKGDYVLPITFIAFMLLSFSFAIMALFSGKSKKGVEI